MPTLKTILAKDISDALATLYENTNGTDSVVKSVTLDHTNTPNRIVSTATSTSRNFVSSVPHMQDTGGGGSTLITAPLDTNRVLVMGNSGYESRLSSAAYAWLQMLEYDPVTDAYYSYACQETAMSVSTDMSNAQMLVLSPTKAVTWIGTTIQHWSIDSTGNIKAIGNPYTAPTQGFQYTASLMSVYDTVAPGTLSTKILFSYASGSNLVVQALNVPDGTGHLTTAGSATTVVTPNSNVSYSAACRAIQKGNTYLAAAGYAGTASVWYAAFTFNPSTNAYTVTNATSASIATYDSIKVMSFSGGSLGGAAGDGTEFNAHVAILSSANTSLYTISHTNPSSLNTSYSNQGSGPGANFLSTNKGYMVNMNQNCAYASGRYGTAVFNRSGASVVWQSTNWAINNDCWSYLLPFASKPAFRRSDYRFHMYAQTTAIASTAGLPVSPNMGVAYCPIGHPTNKTMKWHDSLQVWIAIQGDRVFFLNDDGKVLGSSQPSSNYEFTCLDISPDGTLFIGGTSNSAHKAQAHTNGTAMALAYSASLSGSTYSLTQVGAQTSIDSGQWRVIFEVIAMPNNTAFFVGLHFDGSATWQWKAFAMSKVGGTDTSVYNLVVNGGGSTCYWAHAYTGIIRASNPAVKKFNFFGPRLDGTDSMQYVTGDGTALRATGGGAIVQYPWSNRVSSMVTPELSMLVAPGIGVFINDSTGAQIYTETWSDTNPGRTQCCVTLNGKLAAYSYATGIPATQRTRLITVAGVVTDYSDTLSLQSGSLMFNSGLNKSKMTVRTPSALNAILEAAGSVTTDASLYLENTAGTSSVRVGYAKMYAGDNARMSDGIHVPPGYKLRSKAAAKYQLDAAITVLEGM